MASELKTREIFTNYNNSVLAVYSAVSLDEFLQSKNQSKLTGSQRIYHLMGENVLYLTLGEDMNLDKFLQGEGFDARMKRDENGNYSLTPDGRRYLSHLLEIKR